MKMRKTKNDKGRAMREVRRRLRLRRLDLANRVGCTESLVAKIETGRVEPEDWDQ